MGPAGTEEGRRRRRPLGRPAASDARPPRVGRPCMKRCDGGSGRASAGWRGSPARGTETPGRRPELGSQLGLSTGQISLLFLVKMTEIEEVVLFKTNCYGLLIKNTSPIALGHTNSYLK